MSKWEHPFFGSSFVDETCMARKSGLWMNQLILMASIGALGWLLPCFLYGKTQARIRDRGLSDFTWFNREVRIFTRFRKPFD